LEMQRRQMTVTAIKAMTARIYVSVSQSNPIASCDGKTFGRSKYLHPNLQSSRNIRRHSSQRLDCLLSAFCG